MKKTLTLSLLAATLIGSSAFAECSKETCTKPEKEMNWNTGYTVTSKDTKGKEYYLDITNIQRDIHLGLASANVFGERTANWSLGTGISGIVSDKYYIGANIDADFTNVNSNSYFGLTGELKGGYAFDNKLVGYALVGAKGMDYKNGVNGVGFGAGLGAEYRVCKDSVVAVEYKNYDMTLEGDAQDYNHETLGVKVKYLF